MLLFDRNYNDYWVPDFLNTIILKIRLDLSLNLFNHCNNTVVNFFDKDHHCNFSLYIISDNIILVLFFDLLYYQVYILNYYYDLNINCCYYLVLVVLINLVNVLLILVLWNTSRIEIVIFNILLSPPNILFTDLDFILNKD